MNCIGKDNEKIPFGGFTCVNPYATLSIGGIAKSLPGGEAILSKPAIIAG